MLKRIKRWLAVKAFPFVARHAPEAVNAYIQERASEMAVQVTLGYLAREGIMSCCMCPRRAPLIRVGQAYACPAHVDEARKKAAIPVAA